MFLWAHPIHLYISQKRQLLSPHSVAEGLATLRVNVMFVNRPSGTFTIRSFWKTQDKPGDANSPLLKTSVNSSYAIGIGYWSIYSWGFTMTLQFPQIVPPSWVLGARMAGPAPVLASTGEIIPCCSSPSHCSSSPFNHPPQPHSCTQMAPATPTPSSLPVMLLIKPMSVLSTALYFTCCLPLPGRSLARCSLV